MMTKIKKLLAVLMIFTMTLCLAACGSAGSNEASGTQATKERNTSAENAATAEPLKESSGSSAAAEETSGKAAAVSDSAEAGMSAANTSAANTSAEDTPSHADVLVAYFSATGTTKKVAEKIAAITGADLYEIVPSEPYSSADLNWNDRSSRSTSEQNDKNARPEIGSENISLEGYTTIYLGFPIWWGEEPRILDTFVEKYSFEGITVIPFCTSSSSSIGRSGPNMEALAGSGTWLEGKRFGGNVSETDLQSWIDGLK